MLIGRECSGDLISQESGIRDGRRFLTKDVVLTLWLRLAKIENSELILR